MSVVFPTKAELERQAEQEEKFEKFETKINKEPRVARLRKKLAVFQEQIIVNERAVTDLDKFTKLVKKQVKSLQKVYGGPTAVEDNKAAVSAQRSILTRRITAVIREKEKLRVEKKRLRHSIDELRHEQMHLKKVERRSLEDLRAYLGPDLAIHATVWAMQLKLNRKRYEAGQSQRSSASLSQSCRRTLFAVASSVSKMLKPETRELFTSYIQESSTKSKKSGKTRKEASVSHGSMRSGAPSKGGRSGGSGNTSPSGSSPSGNPKSPTRGGILPLPAELVAALSDSRSKPNRGGGSGHENEFGIIVEKINRYIHLKKDISSMHKANTRAHKDFKAEMDDLQKDYDKVLANEEAQKLLAEASRSQDEISAIDDSSLQQSLGTMSIEEEKRKRRSIQLQVLMRETHKVASQSREQRLSAYQYVFNVIFGITGTSSVDDFLKHYKNNDQSNLRLLQHVSQLENEHQELSDDLEKLRSDSLLNSMDSDAARSAKVHSNIASLKARREATQQALEIARRDLHTSKRLVAAMVSGVKKILAACKDHIQNTKYIGDVLAHHLQAEHEQLGLSTGSLFAPDSPKRKGGRPRSARPGTASSTRSRGGSPTSMLSDQAEELAALGVDLGSRVRALLASLDITVRGIVRTVKKLVSRPSAPGQSSYDVPIDLRTVLAEKALPSMGEILPSKLPNMDDDEESNRSRDGRKGRGHGRGSSASDDDYDDDDGSDDTEAAVVKSVDDSAVRSALEQYEAQKHRQRANITRKTTQVGLSHRM